MLAKVKGTFGFSLIEVLVVLFIIGLVVGMVGLRVNIGSDSSAETLNQQVEEFLQKAQFAEDQAVLTGQPYGLVIEPPNLDRTWTFRWQRYLRGQWDDAEDVLSAQTFAEDVELAAEVEGNAVDFEIFESTEDKQRLPTIIFFPAGEVTPFTMTLYNRSLIDESAMITSEITGIVELLDEEKNYEELYPHMQIR
jgi:general secretion pathway protein H